MIKKTMMRPVPYEVNHYDESSFLAFIAEVDGLKNVIRQTKNI